MTGIICGAAAAVFSAFAFKILKNTEESDRKRDGRFIDTAAFAVYAVIDVLCVLVTERAGKGMFTALNFMMILNFLFLLAVIDIRHRYIPNRYILSMMALRTAMIVVQGVSSHSLRDVFTRSFAGLAAGILVTGLVSLLSKNSLGGGDVKMYGLIGYFAGAFAMLDILVFSTLLCAMCGIILIAAGKCGTKDFLPMAPFAFCGAAAYAVLGI
jgi:Flp pilus assembly protein protease CpaA